MKHHLAPVIVIVFLFVGSVLAANSTTTGGVLLNQTDTIETETNGLPALTTAVEKDPRVQANGKGWRLDRVKITDPNRPRVLLVGDSILNGYLPLVRRALDGKIYVDAWVNPYCQSEQYDRLLVLALDHGPYDVVHINTGLHGWQKGRIPDGQFEPLTGAFIEVIRKKCPRTKIIWASSTPVTVKGKPTALDPQINPIIVEQNRMAAKVMAQMQVPIDDFYSLLTNKLELAHGDQFHWREPAYKILADACVAAVVKALPPKVNPRPKPDMQK